MATCTFTSIPSLLNVRALISLSVHVLALYQFPRITTGLFILYFGRGSPRYTCWTIAPSSHFLSLGRSLLYSNILHITRHLRPLFINTIIDAVVEVVFLPMCRCTRPLFVPLSLHCIVEIPQNTRQKPPSRHFAFEFLLVKNCPSTKLKIRQFHRCQSQLSEFNFVEGHFLTKRNSNAKWWEGGLCCMFYGNRYN